MALWDRIWVNARLATMRPDPAYGAVEDGAVAVADGRIAFAGPSEALPDRPEALARDVFDADGCWITPGLIDCHTHIVHGGNRAVEFEMRLNGASYEEIAAAGGGIVSTVRATRAAGEMDLFRAAERRLRPFLAEGVTHVEIKSGYGLDLETERRQLRVARQLAEHLPVDVSTSYLGAHALPAEFAGDADGYIDHVCSTVLPAIAGEGLADAVDGFCERIAFSTGQIARVFETAQALGLPVKLHAEQLSNQHGAAMAAGFGALSADHLEYLDEDGARAMAAAGTVAVLLPGAYYFLRETRLPPVEDLRWHGVRIAIASDCNPGSAPVGSLLLMLNMASTLFGLTPEEALAGVTREAARALGLGDSHGVLEPGRVADMAFWAIEHPAELAYRIAANPCRRVVKAGRIVLERETA
ncbi:imidazolonepropionase [Oceanibacterium hippocampi]|uniref:Imidazolonepropionase n=1 Tax=Oceanibacterium hippocampi TaxID=745714 RepID=A0A1Y5R8Z6_9PROT|nr:imidazolonepropionase [Oceanibacterium hippocampi]SLN11544.1 Imidazolonepropionase [Oceanibacterium hippocampi]